MLLYMYKYSVVLYIYLLMRHGLVQSSSVICFMSSGLRAFHNSVNTAACSGIAADADSHPPCRDYAVTRG